jgi:hypothetical protein
MYRPYIVAIKVEYHMESTNFSVHIDLVTDDHTQYNTHSEVCARRLAPHKQF